MSDMEFTLELMDEQDDRTDYWNFRLRGVEGQEVHFEIDNLDEAEQYSSYRAAYSYQPLTDDFERFDDEIGDGWTHTFEQDTVYIGWLLYPYRRAINLVTRVRRSDYATTQTIGPSVRGRDMHAIRLEDTDASGDPLDVLVTTRQHAGETMASWQFEAMVEEAIDVFESDSEEWAENYRFHFIPDGNPDGMVNGWHRHNSNGVNLNSIWGDEDPEPEVENMIDYFEEHVETVHWGVDMHTMPGNNTAVYYDEGYHDSEDMDVIDEIVDISPSNDAVESAGDSTTRGWINQELDGRAITTEISDHAEHVTDDLKDQGRGFLHAICETVDN